MRLTNTIYRGDVLDDGFDHEENERLKQDAERQKEHEEKLTRADEELVAEWPASRRQGRLRALIEASKEQKTLRLLRQIWQSDYSILGFLAVTGFFFLIKYTTYPPFGVLFFLLAMAEVDAILSIFVVRLSFHQNKSGFYRTEDYERDWLRYRILLSMTKTALLLVVGFTCGSMAIVGSYIAWFFTSTQRLRYLILRWNMDESYPDLQRWSVFAVLREIGVEPKLKNFNFVAILGVLIGIAITIIF